MEYYQYVKSLHIIFIISWFVGLFYLPRIFVYHTDACKKPSPEKEILQAEYARIAKLLFNAIMNPAMYLALGTGFWMVYASWWSNFGLHRWLHIKLLFVIGVVIFHFVCRKLMLELRASKFRLSSLQLRLFNELATVLLFAIVFLVVIKSSLDWIWGVIGLLIFSIVILSAVRIVKIIREKK